MSGIDRLVAELCPDGVTHAPLGELGDLIRGRRFTKADYVDVGMGSIHYGEVYTDYGTAATETRSFVRHELKGSLRLARTGDLVIAATGENLKDVCKAVAWLGPDEIAVHDDCYIFRHQMDPKFVSYFFQSSAFQEQKAKHASESKVVRVSGAKLAKIKMPVPPSAIQREITAILDKMESLNAELKTELKAELKYRSRQYAFYRDSLLSFRNRTDVEWAPLGKLGEFLRGRRFTKADFAPAGVGCIHYGEIYTRYGTSAHSVVSHLRPDVAVTLRYAQPGDVVVVDVGETVEDVGKAVAWLGAEPVAIHDHSYAFRHSMNPTFVSYCMQTAAFRAEKSKHVARTKVNTLLINGFAKISIPVPPLAEQERIVGILDRFDVLMNDLSIGLPAEIVARRQQYEYYRDRLLTFAERAA